MLIWATSRAARWRWSRSRNIERIAERSMKEQKARRRESTRKIEPRTGAENGGKLSPTALQARFAEAQSRLGPKRQQLVRSILDNSEETCFLSSRELAKRYDVDAATVVRTIQAMGYKSFADF